VSALELLYVARRRAAADGMADLIPLHGGVEEASAFAALKATLDPVHTTEASTWTSAKRLEVLDVAIAKLEADLSAPGRPLLRSGAAGCAEVAA